MTPINTITEAVERLAMDHQAVGDNPDTLKMGHPHHWKTAAVLQQLVKERDEARARVKVLADALRGMMDREARIALQANVHKPLWEASPEWIAAWNTRAALAASPPADPVTNAGCRQPVKAKPLEWEHGRNRLQMDNTMMMGKGYDFDTMELTRQEGYGFGCGYIIWAIRSGLGKKSWNVYGTMDGIFIQDIASEDAAKAAAQADYEGRILAALEPAPVTPAEAAKVLLSNPAALAAMVDAAEEAHEKGVSFNVVIGRALRAIREGEA